jgi:hypothetical protein
VSVQGNQVSMTVEAHGRETSFSGTVDGSKMSGTTGKGSSWSATHQWLGLLFVAPLRHRLDVENSPRTATMKHIGLFQ